MPFTHKVYFFFFAEVIKQQRANVSEMLLCVNISELALSTVNTLSYDHILLTLSYLEFL
jgi:hypothetical protein